MYQFMQHQGLHDLVVIPLQILQMGTARRGGPDARGHGAGVEYVEQQWINRFWSRHWGYNVKAAHVDVPSDDMRTEHCVSCFGRFYGSRVWSRRVNAVYCHYLHSPWLFDDGAYCQYFRGFSTSTLVSLHTALLYDPAALATAVHTYSVPDAFITDQLRPWLQHMLDIRFARLSLKHSGTLTPFCLRTSYSPVLERMNVSAAVSQAAALTQLPPSLHDTLPTRFTFSMPKPMGLFACNHGSVAHTSAVDNIACGCACNQPEFLRFCHPLFGHVLTTDAGAFSNCAHELQDVWRYGFKFRMADQLWVTMSDTVRTELVEQCDAALKKLITHLRKRCRKCPDYNAAAHDVKTFGQAVKAHLHMQLQHTDFADGKSFCFSQLHPHDTSVNVTPLKAKAVRRHFRGFHQHFVITRMDKLSNTYVLMCKQLYRRLLLDDLRTSGFYAAGDTLAVAQSAISAALSSQQFAAASHTYGSRSEMLTQLQDFPYAALLVKMHKNPVKMRFLACNGRNGLLPVALVVTMVFRGVQPIFKSIWTETLVTLKRTWSADGPWLCDNTEAIRTMVDRFNTSCMPYDEYVRGGGWRAWDVVRLFTNIDQQDLIQRINGMLQRMWRRQLPDTNRTRRIQHLGTMATVPSMVMQVFYDESPPCWHASITHVFYLYGVPHDPAHHQSGYLTNDRAGYDRMRGRFHLVTLCVAQTLARLLITEAYVQFEDVIYKQTTGIPMGINPAVFYANMYLASYELEFLEQFTPLLHTDIPQFQGPMQHIVDRMLQCSTPEQLHASDISPGHMYTRYAASELLNHFRWIKRYADDTTVGPNPYMSALLCTSQKVLGDKIHGLYPDAFLTLEQQDSQLHNCTALDVRILTVETNPLHGQPPDAVGFAFSMTSLYEKRREPCFSSFNVLHFQHVTSCMVYQQAYNILHSRLCHLARIINQQSYFVTESARCIHHMRASGYRVVTCFAHVLRFLRKHRALYPGQFKDIYRQIHACYHQMLANPETISRIHDAWHETFHTHAAPYVFVMAPQHPPSPVDMEID
jgi:hypothetical protein